MRTFGSELCIEREKMIALKTSWKEVSLEGNIGKEKDGEEREKEKEKN